MITEQINIINAAIHDLRNGKPVLIFDDEKREKETDLVFPSVFVNSSSIMMLRKMAGGLICTTLKESEARKIALPYIEELYRRFLPYGDKATYSGDMKYDVSSTFSFTINSRRTFTGISDNDRSVTINDLMDFMKNSCSSIEENIEQFYKKFRIPGHVHLLIARDGYFSKRRGHTELSTYLVEAAGLYPSATIAEMLSDSGNSMKREEAEKFAQENELTFIEGKNIIAKWFDDKSYGFGSL
ncbi:3,4-dihydroxy-2-butanone-4-phosphate synthase [Caldiplasma sukawensis]